MLNKQKNKLKHIDACLLPDSQYKKSAGFENIDLVYNSLPEINLKDVCTKTSFLGHSLSAPLMIAPMTGGSELGKVLNERWAKAAQHFGIAFGVGSQRLALEDPSVTNSFLIRKYAKDAFIFANLGAAQLAYWGVKEALAAVHMIDANALFIHLNPLQEACQEHGDTNFFGILKKLEELNKEFLKLKIPLLVREVGFGFSKQAAQRLINIGISGIDCAGAGGTSWSKVESLCSSSETYQKIGESFSEWGIPTVESIKNVRSICKTIPLIATGGIRSGEHIAKVLLLGANLASMGQPMLKAAILGQEELFKFIEQTILEFRITLFAMGYKDCLNL